MRANKTAINLDRFRDGSKSGKRLIPLLESAEPQRETIKMTVVSLLIAAGQVSSKSTRSSRAYHLGGLLLATFAKPSTNFTNSLPSFFAFVSGLWLKTDAGPRHGKTKSGEASNRATYPEVALTPCSR